MDGERSGVVAATVSTLRRVTSRALPPPLALPPPTGAQAGWYRDPSGFAFLRYYDGRRWTSHTTAVLQAGDERGAHPVLPVRVAIGALIVLIGSLVASRFLIDALIDLEWSIVVYTAISIAVGYGPSVAWCWYASRRWGSGRPATDFGLQFRWSDAGWGPIVWLVALGCELAMVLVVVITDIPLIGNTEGIGDLNADRTYVITLLIAAVVAAPLIEEVVFRGLVLRGLLSEVPVVAAVALQGVLFGLAHIDPVRGAGNVGLALILAAVGIALGGAAYLLRRIGPTVIAHAIFNGVVMAVVLLS